MTIIALDSLKKLTLLIWALLIGNQTQSSIITKWFHICIRKNNRLFVFFVCYFFAYVCLCFLFVRLHICFCLFEVLFAHSLCLFQTKKQSMIFVSNKKWSMTWESSNAHHKQDFLACLFMLSLETSMKKMTWKDIRCNLENSNDISTRHNTCNQCLSFHILVLKLVIILQVFYVFRWQYF